MERYVGVVEAKYIHSLNVLPQIYAIPEKAWAQLDSHGHELHHSVKNI